jgi:hypothetical protein
MVERGREEEKEKRKGEYNKKFFNLAFYITLFLKSHKNYEKYKLVKRFD